MSLFKENYLAMVRNSAKGQNHMFRTYYVNLNGEPKDVLKNGGLSCAAFASSVLYLQNPALLAAGRTPWLSSTHANVGSTEKDMERNGWRQVVDGPREGDVVIWEPRAGGDGAQHLHLGFAVGGGRAVSNGSNSTLMPEEHDLTYGGTRAVVRVWRHPALEE